MLSSYRLHNSFELHRMKVNLIESSIFQSNETEPRPWETQRYKSFLCPRFLFIGHRLHSGSLIIPAFQREDSNYLMQKVENAETKAEHSRNSTATVGEGPGPSLRNMQSNQLSSVAQSFPLFATPLSFSIGTKVPAQVEEGNLRLSTRFLEHCTAISPLASRRQSAHRYCCLL